MTDKQTFKPLFGSLITLSFFWITSNLQWSKIFISSINYLFFYVSFKTNKNMNPKKISQYGECRLHNGFFPFGTDGPLECTLGATQDTSRAANLWLPLPRGQHMMTQSVVHSITFTTAHPLLPIPVLQIPNQRFNCALGCTIYLIFFTTIIQ